MPSQRNEQIVSHETPSTPALEVGKMVQTPSGSQAELVAIYADVNEGLVQWTTGDRARFKLGLLRAVPEKLR
jgi:hypothetical protein